MYIIIMGIFGAVFCVGFFSVYLLRCVTADESNPSQQTPAVSEGLEKALIDALPVVSYSLEEDLKEGKEDVECSVCLFDFAEGDSLRLLPKCSHVFHMECIDGWFLSHSTCPLCRASLIPTGGSERIGDMSRRILGAQAEALTSPRHEVILEIDDSSKGAPLPQPRSTLPADKESLSMRPANSSIAQESINGTWISRPSEQDSTILALSQNSESFRNAAVEMWEKLTATSERYSSAVSGLGKGSSSYKRRTPSMKLTTSPIQRSSSVGALGKYIKVGYNSEIFPYGSQGIGAGGGGVGIGSLHRTGSYSGVELFRVELMGPPFAILACVPP